MSSTEVQEILHQLRLGHIKPYQMSRLDRLAPDELISDLSRSYPVVFQERTIRDKHEIGMARKIALETVARHVPGSVFSRYRIVRAIKHCVLVSSYGDSLSEITVLSEIRVRPKNGPSFEVAITTSRGHKLDRTPDGWSIKPLKHRSVTFSESFLLARGWRFEVFGVFSQKP